MMLAQCLCGEEHQAGRAFYVSVVNGTETGFLAGPFIDDHPRAVALVDACQRIADKVNTWSWFFAFGTCSISAAGVLPFGKLNAILNQEFGLGLPVDKNCLPVMEVSNGS